MKSVAFVLVAFIVCSTCLPLETIESSDNEDSYPVKSQDAQAHTVRRRFINPLFNLGSVSYDDMGQLRTKRSYDECEKLRLCKLHARSRVSFFAAYELYFVNKENARLWDHRARTLAECEQRYGNCYRK